MTAREFLMKSIDFRISGILAFAFTAVYFLFLSDRIPLFTFIFFLISLCLAGIYLSSLLRVVDLLVSFRKRNGSLGKKGILLGILFVPGLLGSAMIIGPRIVAGNWNTSIDLMILAATGIVTFVSGTFVARKWNLLEDL